MLKKIIFSCLLSILGVTLVAQKSTTKSSSWYEKKGNLYFENEKYFQSLPYLLKYQSLKPSDEAAKLKIGKCYLETGQVVKATEYFEFLLSQKKVEDEVYLLMARAKHLAHDFDAAILYYKQYLATLNKDDSNRQLVKDNIKRCVIGRKIIYQDELGFVENLGENINSTYDDFAPTFLNGAPDILYYSSIRPGNLGGMYDAEGKVDTVAGYYRSDIYKSVLSKGEWSAIQRLPDNINSVYHDVINGFDESSNLIFVTMSEDLYFDYGDIYMNNNSEEIKNTFKNFKLPVPINSSDWDGDIYFFNSNTVLISSDRIGGYGGKDLYISKKREDGKWSNLVNLGPGVNTPYDEVSPFLAADGKTLYFSSNGLSSMGGFDVFVVMYNEKINNWSKASNLGLPINSAGDDTYFKISEDGLRACFASNRPKGFGGDDLYAVYFRKVRSEQKNIQDTIAFQYAIDKNLLSIKIKEGTILETPIEQQTTPELEVYKFDPLYFSDFGEGETLEMNALMELNKLIKLLEKHKNLKIELASHIDSDQTTIHFNLFSSIKNAENVAAYMIEKGIEPSRIYLKGLGANYPVSKSKEADGTSIIGGRRLNKRIEIKVYQPEKASLYIEYSQPAIIDAMAVNANAIHKRIIKGVSYKVQVKTLKTILDDDVLRDYEHPMIERNAEKTDLFYSVGLVKNYRMAEELRTELINKGYQDAVIIAYKDGQRLETEEEIRVFAETFPDLLNMLK